MSAVLARKIAHEFGQFQSTLYWHPCIEAGTEIITDTERRQGHAGMADILRGTGEQNADIAAFPIDGLGREIGTGIHNQRNMFA